MFTKLIAATLLIVWYGAGCLSRALNLPAKTVVTST